MCCGSVQPIVIRVYFRKSDKGGGRTAYMRNLGGVT